MGTSREELRLVSYLETAKAIAELELRAGNSENGQLKIYPARIATEGITDPTEPLGFGCTPEQWPSPPMPAGVSAGKRIPRPGK